MVEIRNITEEEIERARREQEEYEHSPEYKLDKIAELKAELSSYDYIGTKIAMGVATREDYADKIAYTESLRQQIRELEAE